MLYETLYRPNYHFYVQNGLIEDVGKRENAGKEGIFRPDPFVLKVGVPTLMNMKGCMVSVDYPAPHSDDVLSNDFFFSGMTLLAAKE